MYGKLLAVVALLAGAGLLLLRSYRAPEIGRAALAEARAGTGLSLEAGSYRFSPLRGLELGELRAGSRFPGGSYEVALLRLELLHRLSSLLVGSLAIDRVVVIEPRVILTLGRERMGRSSLSPSRPASTSEPADASAASPVGEGASSSAAGVELALSEVRIERGSFLLRDRADRARLSIQGLSLALASPGLDRRALTVLHGIEGSGPIRIDALRFARTEISSLSGRLEAQGGRLALADLDFAVERGELRGELELDFNSIPFRYALSLSGAQRAPDLWAGPAMLELQASGFGAASRNLSGRGSIELPPGELPDVPWVAALEDRLSEELVGRRHRGARARFRVEANQIAIEELEMEVPPHAVHATGHAGLEGEVELRLVVANLAADTTRSFRLSGTLTEPELEDEK